MTHWEIFGNHDIMPTLESYQNLNSLQNQKPKIFAAINQLILKIFGKFVNRKRECVCACDNGTSVICDTNTRALSQKFCVRESVNVRLAHHTRYVNYARVDQRLFEASKQKEEISSCSFFSFQIGQTLTRAHRHTHSYKHTSLYTQTHIHIYTHLHIHTHTYIHTQTHTQADGEFHEDFFSTWIKLQKIPNP